MVIFEYRSGVYFWVHEHRNADKLPFADRHSDLWNRYLAGAINIERMWEQMTLIANLRREAALSPESGIVAVANHGRGKEGLIPLWVGEGDLPTPGFIRDAGAALAGEGVRINCFGHLGDGNLHYNLFPAPGRNRADYDAERKALSEMIHEMVMARGGSFSAEHGVGRLKPGDLERWADPARLAAMRAIKATLDPLGIMNPGAVLAPARGSFPAAGQDCGADAPDRR